MMLPAAIVAPRSVTTLFEQFGYFLLAIGHQVVPGQMTEVGRKHREIDCGCVADRAATKFGGSPARWIVAWWFGSTAATRPGRPDRPVRWRACHGGRRA